MKVGLGGFKAFLGWMKAHPITAAVIFLIIVPAMLISVLVWAKGKIAALPVVGPLIAKLPVVPPPSA